MFKHGVWAHHMAAQCDDIDGMLNFDNPHPTSASDALAARHLFEHQRHEDELRQQRLVQGSEAGLASIVEQAHEPETLSSDETPDPPAPTCQPLLEPQPLKEVPATPPRSSEVPPTPPNSPTASAHAFDATLPVSVSLAIARIRFTLGRNGRNCSHGKCASKRDLPYHARVIKTTQCGSTRPRNSSSKQGKGGLEKTELADLEPRYERFCVEHKALHYKVDGDSGSDINTVSFTN